MPGGVARCQVDRQLRRPPAKSFAHFIDKINFIDKIPHKKLGI